MECTVIRLLTMSKWTIISYLQTSQESIQLTRQALVLTDKPIETDKTIWAKTWMTCQPYNKKQTTVIPSIKLIWSSFVNCNHIIQALQVISPNLTLPLIKCRQRQKIMLLRMRRRKAYRKRNRVMWTSNLRRSTFSRRTHIFSTKKNCSNMRNTSNRKLMKSGLTFSKNRIRYKMTFRTSSN